ncbi:MAG: YibE/F family protein, partial [Actinomycetota bacterium]|nr:YibE/F family protein [Actinomycetota bacterium]
AGMVVLWPAGERRAAPAGVETTALVDATLTAVTEVAGGDPAGLVPGATAVDVTARIDATGEVVRFETTDDTGATYRAGHRVRLSRIEQPGLPPTYFISDFRRGGPLAVLVALFVAAVLALGRWQGIRALLGLALTFAVIVTFMVPALLGGEEPLAVAIVGSLAIMIVTLYLAHGFAPKTTAAVVGTTLALVITGLLAVAFVGAANLTGFTSEEARLANLQVGGLSLRGLLLAGIVIGGLGVLDDVTTSQASTVFALHRANPTARAGDLTRQALVVGRDHIAATVNTLFLAYAGASLPLLILFATGVDPFGTVVTSEVVAVEVVRTLVGSVGLIAAVPLTTAMAAALAVTARRSGPAVAHDARAPLPRHNPVQ